MKKLATTLCCVMASLGVSLDDAELDAAQADKGAIVGGSDADISKYPWQVSIRNADGNHLCGGSILSNRYVLTAQHCVRALSPGAIQSPRKLRVAAGSAELSRMDSEGQVAGVEDVIPFPGYESFERGKDVALLRLSTPLSFNTKVSSIRVARQADERDELTKTGTRAVVTGWGGLGEQTDWSPDRLQKVSVPIVAFADAKAAYEEAWGVTITPDQLAAGRPGSGKDACYGGSGGALVVEKDGHPVLAGVVSWGASCADLTLPSMYARASSFEDFIRRISKKGPATLLSRMDVSGLKNGFSHFAVDVPSGKTVLNFHISGGRGDGDLFVRAQRRPTSEQFECQSTLKGNDESCSIGRPAPGRWYASVRGFSDYSGIRLKVTAY